MEQRYRGICLSEKNQDSAISQPIFLKFKNNWVKTECWLRILSEKGELPTLTPDDKIYVPEEFKPSEKLKNFYRKKFSQVFRHKRKRMIKGDKYYEDISQNKNKWRTKFSKVLEHDYKFWSDPTNIYDVVEDLKTKKINKTLTEFQKLGMQLMISTFKVERYFEPVKATSDVTPRDLLKIKVPYRDVLVKRKDFI